MTTGGLARPVVAPPWVFYGAPYAPRGLWVRADLCSAQVECSYCESGKWEPCRSVTLGKQLLEDTGAPKFERVMGAYIGGSHHERRKAAKKVPSSGLEITVRSGSAGPPCGGYRISLALPPTVE